MHGVITMLTCKPEFLDFVRQLVRCDDVLQRPTQKLLFLTYCRSTQLRVAGRLRVCCRVVLAQLFVVVPCLRRTRHWRHQEDTNSSTQLTAGCYLCSLALDGRRGWIHIKASQHMLLTVLVGLISCMVLGL
jgi:hypothetical protein